MSTKWQLANSHSIAYSKNPRAWKLDNTMPPLNPLVPDTPMGQMSLDIGEDIGNFHKFLLQEGFDPETLKRLKQYGEWHLERYGGKRRPKRKTTILSMDYIRDLIYHVVTTKFGDAELASQYSFLAKYIHVVFLAQRKQKLWDKENIWASAFVHLQYTRDTMSCARARSLIPRCWILNSVLAHTEVHENGPQTECSLNNDDQDMRAYYELNMEPLGGPKPNKRRLQSTGPSSSRSAGSFNELRVTPECTQDVFERVKAGKERKTKPAGALSLRSVGAIKQLSASPENTQDVFDRIKESKKRKALVATGKKGRTRKLDYYYKKK